MKSRPRIVIDARPLTHPRPGGFRSHIRALTQGLKETGFDREAELIFYVDREPTPEQRRLLPSGSMVRILSPNRLKTDFFLFSAQVRRDAPDLVHGTVNYLPLRLSARTTLTVHDTFGLNPNRRDKSLRQQALEAYWARMSRASLRKASRLITVSHYSASQLSNALKMQLSDFAVIYNGLFLPEACPETPHLREGILAFASDDSRKNHLLLWGFYRSLKEEERPILTLITPDIRAAYRLRTLAESDPRVRIVLCPDDSTVARLYSHAAVFIFPSLEEGFGLPPLEAMHFGCSVMSSSTSAMPEILGDTPYYFSPYKMQEMPELLHEALSQPTGAADRIARGKAHAATFTCRRMAEQTATIWRGALK